MLAYGIKVYLVNGDWGYVCNNGRGGYSLSKDDSQILCFATYEEVKDEVVIRWWGSICDNIMTMIIIIIIK